MNRYYSFSLATSSLTPPRSISISAREGEVTSLIPAWNSPLALPKFRASSGILLAPKRKIANIRRIIHSEAPGIPAMHHGCGSPLSKSSAKKTVFCRFFVNHQKPEARRQFLTHLTDFRLNPLLPHHQSQL